MTSTKKPSIASTIQQLMRDQKFKPAFDLITEQLQRQPNNPEWLYMAACCSRYLKHFDSAAKFIDQLLKLSPGNGRACQEKGHLLLAAGKPHQALPYYIQATQLNPALEASWRNQLKIYTAQGHSLGAEQAKSALNRLTSLPKILLLITDLIAEGRLVKAEQHCRQFLLKAPDHVEGMRLLAEIGVKLGILDDAEFILESAVTFDPDNVEVRIDYLRALRKRQKFADALKQAAWLLNKDNNNPRFQSLYAIEAMQTGDYESAIDYFDRALEQVPNDPGVLTSKGHALKTWGKQADAIEAYRKAVAAKPSHGDAWYSLANLKIFEFTDGEVDQMTRLVEGDELMPNDQTNLFFALGKAFEDRKNFELSFDNYVRGNRIKKAQSKYDADKMQEEFLEQESIVTPELIERNKQAGCMALDPIFIVGLPRAGSTLLEQILSSHSQVDGTLELPNVISLAHRLRRGKRLSGENLYPSILAELSPSQYREYGEAYIEDTRIHRQSAPFFIDKMPNNFRHIGLIKMMLPNAKIIDARRHPIACCFSAYKQLFAEGQEFSYSLNDIGQYYSDYVKLMKHWDEVLPGQILRVHYEHVVADLEGQVRRVLDFCGLPFENACLSFHETKRSVRTASSEQVRKPIYRSGLEQWRHYSGSLHELESQLADIIDHYPD
jgi:tetratricopeptide (TPR) repeat protein